MTQSLRLLMIEWCMLITGLEYGHFSKMTNKQLFSMYNECMEQVTKEMLEEDE